MTKIVNSLLVPTAPNLPAAPKMYDGRYHDQLANVLRLYFNRLGGTAIASLLGPLGGQHLNTPQGEFQSRTTQTQTTVNTQKLIALDTTTFALGMYRVIGDGVHVEQPGIYNIQFSAQLTNNAVQDHDAAIWLRKNGVDVPYSASVVTVPSTHGGIAGHYVVAANFYIDLQAGDYIEFWWAASNLAVQIETLPPITTPFTSPGSPGFVVTVTFVSTLTTT